MSSTIAYGISSANFTVGSSTAVLVTPDASTINNRLTVVIQNNHGSNTLYVGDSTVSSSNYGVQLAFGASVSLDDLAPNMPVYVVASGASTPVSALYIKR
jgi:hypothetical protein